MSSNISQPIIDKIFSHDVFKGLDRDGLVKRYDVTGSLRVREIGKSITFHATRSTTTGPPRYNATVVVPPKEYGITRLGTTKPVKVILEVTLERA